MPLRACLKRLIPRSEGPEALPDGLDQTDGQQRPVNPQPNNTRLGPALDHASQPQGNKLRTLWDEAYEQLSKEDEKLIAAFEEDLLQQDDNRPRKDANNVVLSERRETRLQTLVERRLADIQEGRLKFTVGGREIVVKDQVHRIIRLILSFKDAIQSATSSNPHAALAWGGILALLQPMSNTVTQEKDAIDGFEQISTLLIRYRLLESTHSEIFGPMHSSSRPTGPLEEIHASLRAKTVNLYKEVLKYQMRLARHYSRSDFPRIARDLAALDNWKNMLKSITDIDNSIKEDLNVLGVRSLKEIDDRISSALDLVAETRDEAKAAKQFQLLEKLPHAAGARFDSYEAGEKRQCLAGTQVEILAKIQEWIEDPDGRSIFKLHGMAGTGKSTISYTVAAASHNKTRLIPGPVPNNICLGGTFFLDQYVSSRNNLKQIFTTLALSMAEVRADLKVLICDAIEEKPNVGDFLLEIQWNNLIFQPLANIDAKLPRSKTFTLIFVIDALDECQSESDLSLVLQLMSRVKDLQNIKVRFFLTSRPEAYIESCFWNVSKNLIYAAELNKVNVLDCEENTPDDIMRFLSHEMEGIKRKKRIEKDWPGQAELEMLHKKADGLFIYAVTACRFLGEPNLESLRDQRLKLIFDNKVSSNSPQGNLDAMYLGILQASVLGDALEEEKAEISSLFKTVVGSIVVLFEPLSPRCLSALVEMPLPSLKETLQGLRSVLTVPESDDDTIRLLHLSFPDFLIDSERCRDDNFCISEAAAHDTLFRCSLKVMSNSLRKNICSLPDPWREASEVEQSLIIQNIPVHLQYACCHWVYHLQRSGEKPTDNGEVHQFLQTHLLHWLEAVSLLGKMHEGVQMILVLLDYVNTLPVENRIELKSLLQDARRFVLKFRSVIETNPLHLYISGLIFSPSMSVIRNLFQGHIPEIEWLVQMPETDPHWDSLTQTFPTLLGDCVTISPDGKLMASTSGAIWDIATGTLVRQLDLRVDRLGSQDMSRSHGRLVDFSRDGKEVIYVTGNGNFMKWDVTTGLLKHNFIITGRYSKFAVISQHRNMIAIGSGDDRTGWFVTFVTIGSGVPIKKETACLRRIRELAISPDGTCVASAYCGINFRREVGVWDTATAELRHTLRGDLAVAYSPNGQVLASADSEGIYLWDASNGAALLSINEEDTRFLAFSPDSLLLASSNSRYIHSHLCLWGVATGALLQKFDAFTRPVFSPNGKMLASFFDGETRIWETESGRLAKVLKHSATSDMTYSPDGTVLATPSKGKVQLWDLTIDTKGTSCTGSVHGKRVDRLILGPSAEQAVSFTFFDLHMVWDVKTTDLLNRASYDAKEKHGWVNALSPDGTLIARSHSRNDVEIINLKTGKSLRILKGHADTIHEIQFAPNSKLLASASDPLDRGYGYGEKDVDSANVSICLWDVTTGELLQNFHSPLKKGIECLSFSLDGRLLAAAFGDGDVHIWEAKTGVFLKILEHPDNDENRKPSTFSRSADLSFSSDDKTVITISPSRYSLENNQINVWDVDSGTMVRNWDCDGLCLTLSPKDNLLATSSHKYHSSEVKLWDPATGYCLGCYDTEQRIWSLAFSNDGEYLDTDMGRLSIEMIYPGRINAKSSNRDPEVFVRNPWVFHGTKKILYLPPAYHATCASYRDGVLAMGHENGRVSFFRFDLDKQMGSL